MSAIRPSTHIAARELSDHALREAIQVADAYGLEGGRLEELKAELLRRQQSPKPRTLLEVVEDARQAQLEHERRIAVQLELGVTS